jgi:amino acid adenylation domain-containing protein
MSSLEDKTDLLPAEKRAWLAELLRKKAAGNRQVPISFAQQRLWFLDQLEPGNASFNISRAVRVKGKLNLEALRQALNATLARHESLRTNFTSIDDEPVQVIAPTREIELQLVDLGELPETNRESEARRLASEEARRAFNIAQDQLLRVALFRLDDQDQVLLLVLHHIVSDGWSMGILYRELETLYEAFDNSCPSPLPPLPIQYGDFARWQRDWLQGQVLDEQLNFWKQQLAGAPAMLELSTDKPRPAIQTFGGAYHTSMVGKELTDSLNELSRREGGTLFMTLVAAFQTMLYRYTNQQDIVVGTPIANRTRTETEDLIGLFVNTLVVRTHFSGNPSFKELLGRVREVSLDAFAHQDLPFEKLVEEIQPERSLGHMPLFQVLFALQNVPKSAWKLGSLDLTDFALDKSTSKLDLSLYVGERVEGLSLTFEYSTDLFDTATIERMAANFQTLLEGVVANPEQRISELPLLTKRERAQLLGEWNETEAEYRAGKCIHELFEEQVQKSAAEIALISEKAKLTFGELNSRANQLAHFLKKRGVGPEVLVGVCIERSIEMVVGLLAILKAGGAYVPLDPSHPTERISFMLHDSGARLLLTQQHLGETLASWDGETIYVDSEWPEIARASVENPANTASVANAAYVLYTSGSTDRPKGVVSAHRGSINRFEWMWRAYPFVAGEVCCQKTSLSFGDSIWEIFGPLLQGVPLVLIPDEVVKDPRDFIAALSANRVTRLVLVPSLLRVILETSENLAQQLKTLSYCVCSGETLPAELARNFREQVPHTTLLNLYGSSEVAADVLYYEVSNTESINNIPIGKPIANTDVFILDSNFQPVPLGVLGEICVGGDGLARGYWNSAQLTAEKFVPHPFSRQPGSRLFRTGDIGRYLPDGNIEYHGRRDYQVKVRGYRIELGEIETALKGYSSVQDAVVMLRQLTPENKQLVGYIVTSSNQAESQNGLMVTELKSVLKKMLPDYMVPAHFVFLPQLPLTPSGKIDRRALPQPDGTRPELEEAHVAPRDDLERRLANIWERLLAVQPVGVRDNFFNLGGHSLLAVKVVSEIQKETGQRLPLISFFQGPNIEYLASLLRQDVRSLSWPTLVEIQAGGPNAPLFCVSMPNVNALGYRSLARHLGADQPVFGLQAQYPEDLVGEHSQAAVDEIVTDYLEVLRGVRLSGPYQFVGLCRGAHIAYELARRLEQEGKEVALLGIIDTWVMENTYNKFWLLQYYAKRLISLILRGIRKQFGFMRKKAQGGAPGNGHKTPAPADAERKQKTMKVYFPGPDFVPTSFRGRIAVFRTRRQPRNRIHDANLGWGKLARGGVDLHFIPGGHESVLREPHVKGLAAALKKCLRQSD